MLTKPDLVVALTFIPLAAAIIYMDVRYRRIPNKLVLLLLLGGVVAALLTHGPVMASYSALLSVVGLALWLPFYGLGMMGAGDVKLFAASSAWLLSIAQVLAAAAASAIVGGALAIIWALAQRRTLPVFGTLLTRLRFNVPVLVDSQREKVPYGVAMAIGVLWSFTRI